MTRKRVDTLLRYASGPSSHRAADLTAFYRLGQKQVRQVEDLLRIRNGFAAFGGALLWLPGEADAGGLDAVSWNRADGWIADYGELARDLFFFAQDLFGNQFACDGEGFWTFDADTGEREKIADALDEMIGVLLGDYDYYTGASLLQEWIADKGPLPVDCRLFPKIPFVLGGDYETANLWVADPRKVMGYRGWIASQIKDLPDGTYVHFDLTEVAVRPRPS
ncbi:hypothetical protein [Tahibacter amnicola]|uniref:SMI1/KNR4 family protein n=1 Tax=Tahibacter amnicola TaxID=2976241 RepID=A0ABY6BCA8_9GAMM|nr:hypothetical protein [Tahibacter amnicola]UXI66755.1 hypothetical protein N4264_18650 [Tahibacter amnicola]